MHLKMEQPLLFCHQTRDYQTSKKEIMFTAIKILLPLKRCFYYINVSW